MVPVSEGRSSSPILSHLIPTGSTSLSPVNDEADEEESDEDDVEEDLNESDDDEEDEAEESESEKANQPSNHQKSCSSDLKNRNLMKKSIKIENTSSSSRESPITTTATNLADAQQLQKTLKEALKAAADQRQRQKRNQVAAAALAATANNNNNNTNNLLAELLLSTVTSTNLNNQLLSQQQQQQFNAIFPLMLQGKKSFYSFLKVIFNRKK